MTPRQCEIAAESHVASLFAQAGYDVLIQYGANQPHYDLVAEKDGKFLPISVKGNQDGGWMLAVKYKNKNTTYHEAIDLWLAAQREDLIYVFVQFLGVSLGEPPRVYIARPKEIAAHMKTQRDGKGYGALQEDIRRIRKGSQYSHCIPSVWKFTLRQLNEVAP
jgi:Holliday junction resolvase-like predicted endonuclease